MVVLPVKHLESLGEGRGTPRHYASLAVALVVALLAAWQMGGPDILPAIFFFRQDLPVLCAMAGAGLLFPYLRTGRRWRSELRITPAMAVAGAALIVTLGVVGRRAVMFDYDLSRDEQLASLAARQIASGTVVTPVPAEWQPVGQAMLPNLTFHGLPADRVWASGYLPVNSAFRALVGTVADPAVANPLLLVVGLAALWHVARRLWPGRNDAAVVVLLLAATSTQLLTASMTSYAMTGYFALNMVWLALFLRGGWWGIGGALLVGLLATGLHEIHFHPMFVAPFLVWLAWRRQWRTLAVYGLGYAAIGLDWWKLYPALVAQSSGVPLQYHLGDIWTYIGKKLSRLFAHSPLVWLDSLARFAAWQNLLLLPLAAAAIPLLRTRQGRDLGVLLPLFGVCLLGLLLMVEQGPGWGYRYLHGQIGAFCLLAGYGWCRIVPQPGPARAWALLKFACAFTVLLALPVQLAMARSFVRPAATLQRAIRTAPADVVLVDTEGGLFPWDLVRNGLDFRAAPKAMDLALVPGDALASLCRTRRVLLVDRRHYRAVSMAQLPAAKWEQAALPARRALLQRLHCGVPLKL
jgi:hypothetical protein